MTFAFFVTSGAALAQTPASPEFATNRLESFNQGYQNVAVSKSGEILVVWLSRTADGNHTGMWAQWFSPQGEPMGGNLLLRSSNAQNYFPLVAPGAHGGVLVLWSETRRTQVADWEVLMGGELLPDGSWSLPPRYLTFLGSIRVRFASPLPQGGYAITLLGSRPNRTEDRTFLVLVDKDLKVIRGPSRVNATSRSIQEVGGLAVSPSGEFLVTWTQAETTILAQLFSPAGRPLAPAFKVPEGRPVAQFAGAAAALGNEGYVIVWSEDDSETGIPDLAMRLLKLDGTPRSSTLRLDPEVRFRGFQEVAADASGNFVVVWQEGGPPDGSWDIWGRAYHPDGTPYGPKVRLNQHIDNDQTSPQVAFAPNGTFVAVWISSGQDGDRDGVYGRVFSLSQPNSFALPSASRTPP
jgi:large repetitive protein